MRANAKKFSRVLIPLALAAFGLALVVLVLGSGLPVTPVKAALLAPGDAVLTVTVESILPGPDICVGEGVTITLVITNTSGDAAQHVTSTMQTGSGLTCGGPSQDDLHLSVNETAHVYYVCQCDAPGTSNFTATVQGSNADPEQVSGSITQQGAELDLSLESAPALEVCVDATFVVTLTIANNGTISATTVVPTLTVEAGDVTCDPLSPSSAAVITNATSATFTSTCTCDARGVVTITADATGNQGGPCGGAIDDAQINEDSLTLTQQEALLSATMIASKSSVAQGGHFDVTVTATNNGNVDLDDTTPTLTYSTTLAYCDGPTPPAGQTVAGGGHLDFTWNCTCTMEGTVSFTALVTGTDSCSQETLQAPAGPITVDQEEEVDVGVEWLDTPGGEVVISQDFRFLVAITSTSRVAVEATFSFAGDATVLDKGAAATANIVPEDWVEVYDHVQPYYKFPIEWWLHCDGETKLTNIKVTAGGKDFLLGYDIAQRLGHPKLEVEIFKPEGGANFCKSDTFSVMAYVRNTGGEPALDVSAEIDLPTNIDFVGGAPGDVKKYLVARLLPGEYTVVDWNVHCTGAGGGTITVTPEGRDDVAGDWLRNVDPALIVPGNVTVDQELACAVAVSITAPDDKQVIGMNTTYSVTAHIDNNGCTTTTVTAILSIDGEAALAAGEVATRTATIAKYGDTEVSWDVECKGYDTDTRLTVDVDAKSERCGSTCDATAYVEVYQKDLIVEIDDPGDQKGSNFSINACATNYLTTDLLNTETWIDVVAGPATLSSPPPASQTVGTIGGSEGKECVPTEWHIDAYGYGDITVRVYFRGIRADDGETVQNEDTLTFTRYEGAKMSVEIVDPQTCQWYAIGDEIDVKAKIENTGDWEPSAAEVTLTWSGNASLTGAAAQDAIIGPGSTYKYWTMQCTGPCDVVITTTLVYEDPIIVTDVITVHQMPMKATIGQYPNYVNTGSTFGVHAVIENTCTDECGTCEGCALYDVNVKLEKLEGPASFLDGDTRIIETVVKDDSQDAEWTLKCEGPGVVKLQVTAWTWKDTSGNDLLDPETGDPYSVTLQTDWIAVAQVRDLGYDIQLCKHWNYLSLPLIPFSDRDEPEQVLDTMIANVVDLWAWDAENETWKFYAPDWPDSYYDYIPYAQITEMADGVGYRIRMLYPDVLEGEGFDYRDLPEDYPLMPTQYGPYSADWHLIGFTTSDFVGGDGWITAVDDMDAEDYLHNFDSDTDGDVIWDEVAYLRTYTRRDGCGDQKWLELTDTDELKPGEAYWFLPREAGLYIVPPMVQNP